MKKKMSTYHHFIGEIGEKNTLPFVVHVFETSVVPLAQRFRSVQLWSDGGPKHFKISSLLEYLNNLVL